ncbi:hypothetical protein [Actinomyces naeslundii]|uniref:hypothetical protein n=1 Tax=Actinomyces naeslundii TaxID=1655 RepID=UPI00094C91E3|nr:hypothetical protein [Actinomyces naeslundii]OLO85132.1 hypothetical protein BKH12_04740 [Actinomyces naeslundii]
MSVPVAASLTYEELATKARALHLEAMATLKEAYRTARQAAESYADAPVPPVMGRLESLTPEALESVGQTIAFGERLGYQAGFEAACALFPLVSAAGYTAGQKDLAAGQEAAHRQWLDAENRSLVASLTRGAPYPTLCEIRGEPARAEHARQLYAERGIA